MNEDEDTAIISIMSLIRVHSRKRRRKEKKKNFRGKNYDRVSNYNKKYIFALCSLSDSGHLKPLGFPVMLEVSFVMFMR